MNAEHRIKELKTRQIFYGSSLVCKLRKEDGVFHYDISLWLDQGETDNKSILKTGLYQDQDPEELFSEIELEIGKYRLGKRVLQ